ncbi:MAG: response regulator [Rhodoferax sp.]|nr:response regulator [Rhodoferax sp.]MDP3651488.1 response regulator [Rhodoferax sp.]
MSQDEASLERKLLIVDDSKVSRMIIRAFFAKMCPAWVVQEAGSGDAALTLLADFQPDFVTMDVNMPGINGFDAAEQILARDPKVRLVMLSANIQESSVRMAASLRLNFVAKPATEASLQQALNHLLAAT